MKTEMLEAVDVVEMKRLGGGKVGYSTIFLFFLHLFFFAFLFTYMSAG